MIDFHSHILPRMDDGSHSSKESILMLRSLSGQGVKKVFATPHFYANSESVDVFLERRRCSYERIKSKMTVGMPEIVLGAEVKYYSGITHLDKLDSLCIEGSRLLLLEMPESRWTEYTLREVIEIQTERDIVPVIAHVERCIGYQDSKTVYRLLDSGVMMQINASFLNGFFSRIKALNMLKNNQIHFIGSDCHNMSTRKPDLANFVKKLEGKVGEARVRKCMENAQRMLENKEIN